MKKRVVSFILLMLLCFPYLVSCGAVEAILNLPWVDENDGQSEKEPDGDGEEEGKNEIPGSQDKYYPIDSVAPDYDLAGELEKIDVPARFKTEYTIERQKLVLAKYLACRKLKEFVEENGTGFVDTCSDDYKYTESANNNWVCGMYTGTYLMAYQLTGDQWFADVVNEHIDSFVEREEKRVGMDYHDVGFVFVPSCVGAYKVLGSEKARDAALRAVEYYYGTSYSKEGTFIIRAHKAWDGGGGCRTMIDSMMNASLFYWSGEYLGNALYSTAAKNHTMTSINLLVREDGSTYHHYQFDPETAAPLYGLTWQGYADESCWSRGHSWGIYGFSIAYSYANSREMLDAQSEVTYYMLNHLPEDLIPYWDYTFITGDEPRDVSAAAIAVCGMLDMAELLPEGSPRRIVYESAAAQILEAIIDGYTGNVGVEYDGLVHGVTHGKPQGLAIEECAPYADYFYLEALARYLDDDFIRPW